MRWSEHACKLSYALILHWQVEMVPQTSNSRLLLPEQNASVVVFINVVSLLLLGLPICLKDYIEARALG